VAWFRSRGPTLIDGVAKPDLVAPGLDLGLPVPNHSGITVANPSSRDQLGTAGHPWIRASGTSFSAPQVSGTVALMLEVNPSLRPNAVKAILQGTAQTLSDASPLDQGAGLLNAAGAVRLASIWNTDPRLLPGDDQLLAPIADEPFDLIEGEVSLWGSGIIWNGVVLSHRRYWDRQWSNGVTGSLEGTGIIWNGYRADEGELAWLDYQVSGIDLLRFHQEAWAVGSLWGSGIIWNGVVVYEPAPSFSTQSRALWKNRLIRSAALGNELLSSGPHLEDTEPVGLVAEPGSDLIVIPQF
jgi:hypothetical protein